MVVKGEGTPSLHSQTPNLNKKVTVTVLMVTTDKKSENENV